MVRAWSRGELWEERPVTAQISMPCVVDLPEQCDRVWRGWRSAREKRVYNADGSLWPLGFI